MAALLERYDPAKNGWTRREATHLLWRGAGGASDDEIARATEEGLAKSVERLVERQKESEEFLHTERLLRNSALDSGNIATLKNWWLYRLLNSANPLEERMTLFWHNHFATSNAKVRSTEKMAAQNDLLRKHALGSFADLFRGMARDVAMLVWLDGNANRKRQPNENFAREVMELFSLGVGNYTETDIKEAARAFTGWHLRNEKFWFNKIQHDAGTKKVLGKSGNFKGDDILEVCLEQPACPRYLATKLLSTFVTPKPETALVEALAKRIRTHEFEMRPVMKELFLSRAFFAPAARRSIIKSPVDLAVSTNKALGGHPNLPNTVQWMSDLGQSLFEPPTVKGWEGGRLWINSATVLQRANFASEFTNGKRFGTLTGGSQRFDDANSAVAHFVDLLLGLDLPSSARKDLAKVYSKTKGAAKTRAHGLVQVILTMPEYQLI